MEGMPSGVELACCAELAVTDVTQVEVVALAALPPGPSDGAQPAPVARDEFVYLARTRRQFRLGWVRQWRRR